jgi:hypothetical protein
MEPPEVGCYKAGWLGVPDCFSTPFLAFFWEESKAADYGN